MAQREKARRLALRAAAAKAVATVAPQAIETRYRGHRFRSRLEARWAVAFDTLGLAWDYEPQGYLVGAGRVPYLPDFWLPDLWLWAEVKGVLGIDDLATLVAATSSAGLPLTPYEPLSADLVDLRRILVLGTIPPPGSAWTHTVMGSLTGSLVFAQDAFFRVRESELPTVLEIGPRTHLSVDHLGLPSGTDILHRMTHGRPCEPIRQDPEVAAAYAAARCARFEYGESG